MEGQDEYGSTAVGGWGGNWLLDRLFGAPKGNDGREATVNQRAVVQGSGSDAGDTDLSVGTRLSSAVGGGRERVPRKRGSLLFWRRGEKE